MPTAKDIAYYNDVRLICDTAIARGGAKYQLPTKGKAVHWRQRAYTFRKLARVLAQKSLPDIGLIASTPYDRLEFVFDEDPTIVIIRYSELKGQLMDLAGAPITETVTPTEPIDDELLLIANDLVNRHS